MQLSEIQTKVLQTAGLDSTDNYSTSTVLTSFINDAIRAVDLLRDWDWSYSSETITTVAGTDAYDPAVAWRSTVRIVDDATDTLLRRVSPEVAVRYQNANASLPAYWYIEAGAIYLVPTPTTVRTYTHVYLQTQPALATATDTPSTPDWAINLVIVKAALKLAARTDNTSMQRLLQAEERQLLSALENDARRARGPQGINYRRDYRI